MSTEERTRFEVLLENLQTSVNVIAEGHGALVERLDRMETRFETRFDRFEAKVDGLEVKVNGIKAKVDGLEAKVDGLEAKVDGLEVFASDSQRRLTRIETHLPLNGSSHSRPPPKAAKAASPKQRKTS